MMDDEDEDEDDASSTKRAIHSVIKEGRQAGRQAGRHFKHTRTEIQSKSKSNMACTLIYLRHIYKAPTHPSTYTHEYRILPLTPPRPGYEFVL